MTFAEEMHKLADEHYEDSMISLIKELKDSVNNAANKGFYDVEVEVHKYSDEKANKFYPIVSKWKSRRILKSKLKQLGLDVSFESYSRFFNMYTLKLYW